MKTENIEKIIEITDKIREHITEDKEYDCAELTEIFEKEGLCELSDRLGNEERIKEIETRFASVDKNQMSRRLRNSIIKKQKEKRRRILYLATTSVAAALIAVSMLLFYPKTNSLEGVKLEKQMVEPMLITTLGDSLSNDTAIKNYIANQPEVEKKQSCNQLIVPAGCTYTIQLPDSTEVLLNSGSTLIFPDTFSDDCRNVILTGEAFFRVTKDKKPFIVIVEQMEVKVYGTEFNINARQKNLVQTILVEGSVGVRCYDNPHNEIKLKPNELCSYDLAEHQGDVSEINVSDYLSWTENLFLYNERTLEAVLSDFEAWYGVKFNLHEEIASRSMTFRMSRKTELKEMLSLLEKAAEVQFIQKNTTEYDVE